MSLSKGVVFETRRHFDPTGRLTPSTWEDMSRDKNDLAFTGAPSWTRLPTGLWTPTFNGTTQYASKAVADFRKGDFSGAIEAVFNTTSIIETIFASADTGTTAYLLEFLIDGNGVLQILQNNNDVLTNITAGTTVNTGRPQHAFLNSSGTAYSVILNGATEALTLVSGVNNGDWFGDTTLRDNITVGAIARTSVVRYFTGNIPFVRIYSYPPSLEYCQARFQQWRRLLGV